MNGRNVALPGNPPDPEPQIVGYALMFYGPTPSSGFPAACVPANIASNSFARAFLYDAQTSTMIDLNLHIPNNPEWYLSYAWGINNLGQIVGEGRVGGQKHAFLLLPM
jgi:hypothetical protein